MNEETLLEKAKKVNMSDAYMFDNKEVMELSYAWAKGEVRLKQVAAALGIKNIGSLVYQKLAMGLRQYIQSKENK